ncbi:DUF1566 domain-containing protein [Psychromonas ossibalaenae]|uniref:Lcl C-terminal domain-containing protein n=1 Tax=Psychromonas ossibalaenae TaxID=444922 RepID=UPI00037694FD|nr:DUF1566 domain-containing protein [Psychromonas ossibalaenae]
MKTKTTLLLCLLLNAAAGHTQNSPLNHPIVDSNVSVFYDNNSVIKAPKQGEPFYGQDAHYQINPPSYSNNGNGTINDNITGLMWQQEMAEKLTFEQAVTRAQSLKLGGFNDWRLPSIKELYSLIQFSGRVKGQKAVTLFIDTDYFQQPLGTRRQIDAQTWSATQYVGRTMRNDQTVFGVNFVDGRIKGYPKFHPRSRQANKMYFRFVRGNKNYGKNRFIDNSNGTITDAASGLMWQKADSAKSMNWQEALAYAENLQLAGYSDWRLPSAKELHSIVDYSRSSQTTNSAALSPLFNITIIKDPQGRKQYPYFWSSTTHLDGRNPNDSAVYFAFGEAQGKMHNRLMDVHGAGAQRSDPKSGSKKDYPQYFGPQGDIRYVFNYVRSVRTINR